MAALVTAAAVDAAPRSTRTPAGEDALLADLLWWVALTSAVAWLASLSVLCYCLVAPRRGSSVRRSVPAAEPQHDRTADAACLTLEPTRAGTAR